MSLPTPNVYYTPSQHISCSIRHEYSLSIAEASCIEPGEWDLNRVNVKAPEQGKGIGLLLVKTLTDTLLEDPNFKRLVVTPGGYGSDVTKLWKFYQRCGFKPCETHLEFTRPENPRKETLEKELAQCKQQLDVHCQSLKQLDALENQLEQFKGSPDIYELSKIQARASRALVEHCLQRAQEKIAEIEKQLLVLL